MHHVTVTFRSRKVPGAMSDEELFNLRPEDEDAGSARGDDDYADVLTEEERKQLKKAMENTSAIDLDVEGSVNEAGEEKSGRPLTPKDGHDREGAGSLTQESGRSNEGASQLGAASTSESEGLVSGEKPARKGWFGWGKKEHASSEPLSENATDSDTRSGADSIQSPMHSKRGSKHRGGDERKEEIGSEMEFSKGLKPTLWLTDGFPLRVEELLPLLDLLSPRVKAVRRLRELLTVKMPRGTFPVKVRGRHSSR